MLDVRRTAMAALCASACLLPACAPDEPPAEVASQEQELVVPRAWVQSLTTVTPDGDDADVYVPMPPTAWRSFFVDAFPVVVVLQGGLVDKAQYGAFGRELARHGFTVVVPNHLRAFGPGAPPVPFTEGSVIADALAAAQALDADPTSDGYEIIDGDRMAITGHSLGGVVGLSVIGQSCPPPLCVLPAPLPAEVEAAAFYGTTMVQPPPQSGILDVNTGGIEVALLRGSEDGNALPTDVGATYDTLDDGRALITIVGANHFGITDDAAPATAQPDPNPSTISQPKAQRNIARWTALWLRSELNHELWAGWWLYEFGGSLGGDVVVDAIE